MSDRAKLFGFQAASRVPDWLWLALSRPIAAWMTRRQPKAVRQWQLNYQVVTGRPADAEVTRAAMRSWLLNTVASLRIGRWSTGKINDRVEVQPADHQLLVDLHQNQGLVMVLPHMGSWDLAGCWACLNGLPVVSVAENLPAGQFEYFRQVRADLGMKIYRQRESELISKLSQEVKSGRCLALVADRDFSRKGEPVTWPTANSQIDLTLPAGPALVAQATGAAVVPVALHFASGKLVITLGAPIQPRPGQSGLREMLQNEATFFGEQIQRHPVDWHMLQRFFPGVEA